MGRRRTTAGVAVLAVALVCATAFVLGRVTAHPSRTTAGSYLDGLRVGEVQGRREGRAEQEGAALPPGDRAPVQHAFDAGYAAGADDVFSGYDGGWTLGVPWIVQLEAGSGGIAYRIARRTAVEPGTDYSLCPDGRSLCTHPR